jgi:hypothetical protein
MAIDKRREKKKHLSMVDTAAIIRSVFQDGTRCGPNDGRMFCCSSSARLLTHVLISKQHDFSTIYIFSVVKSYFGV